MLISVYRQMLKIHTARCSVGRALCDLDFRTESLDLVRAGAGACREFDILQRLHDLRNRVKPPRPDGFSD